MHSATWVSTRKRTRISEEFSLIISNASAQGPLTSCVVQVNLGNILARGGDCRERARAIVSARQKPLRTELETRPLPALSQRLKQVKPYRCQRNHAQHRRSLLTKGQRFPNKSHFTVKVKPNNNSTVGTIRVRSSDRIREGMFALCRLHQIAHFCLHSDMRATHLFRHFLKESSDLFTVLQTCTPIVLSVAGIGFFGLRFADIWAQVTRIDRWVKANSAIPQERERGMAQLDGAWISSRPETLGTRNETTCHLARTSRSLSWGRGLG